MFYGLIKTKFSLVAATVLLSTSAFAADYNLGELARSHKIELFNRSLDQTKVEESDVVHLNASDAYGLAWITGVEFSGGIIELEVKGRDQPGQSFVGIAFHGQDNETFDAVYLRPFNFRAAEIERRSHSVQYISLPEHDWSDLRKNHPGKYESALNPAPKPDSWVKLRLVVERKGVSAFVNGADKPALSVEVLNERHKGKLGLWVGNDSEGWFRNLRIIPAGK